MTRYSIHTPVPNASGDVGPVHFHLGRAEVVDPPSGVLQYCREAGYTVRDLDAEAAALAEAEIGDNDGDRATPPPGNASAEAWRQHALSLGATEDQAANLNRDQLKTLAASITGGSAQ